MKKIIFTSLFLFVFGGIFSQRQVQQSKSSFKIDLCLPNTVANYAFNRIHNGLADVSMYYQYNVFNGLTVGGGLRYAYFMIDQFSVSNPISGGLHMPSAFLKVGYEKFTTDRFAYEWSLNSGYTYAVSSNDSTKAILGEPFIDQDVFIQPKLGLYLIADQSAAFSLILSYTWFLNNFRPEYHAQDGFSGTGMKPSDWAGVTQFFSVGFGYSHYFGRK